MMRLLVVLMPLKWSIVSGIARVSSEAALHRWQTTLLSISKRGDTYIHRLPLALSGNGYIQKSNTRH
jgi:hypothetical protein